MASITSFPSRLSSSYHIESFNQTDVCLHPLASHLYSYHYPILDSSCLSTFDSCKSIGGGSHRLLEERKSFKMDSSSSHFERSNGPVLTLNCGGPNDFLLNGGLKSDYVGLSHHHGDGWSPSAPSPGLVLFNSEEQSDLIFIVTMDSSNHRPDRDDLKFPAHSFIIKESSPIFKEIIHELNQRQSNQNSDQKPIINIQCRPETLHMLMR